MNWFYSITLVCVALSASTSAQGTLNLNNLRPGQEIWDCDGGPGPSVTAQLVLANQGTALLPLSPLTTFFSEPGADHWLIPIDIVVPGTSPGTTHEFFLQLWDSQFGTYQEAVAAGALRAESTTFYATLGGGTLPPGVTSGLEGLYLCIPEPSTGLLALVGLVAFGSWTGARLNSKTAKG